LGAERVLSISLDSFYHPFDKRIQDPTEHNFDHPLSLDWALIDETCSLLADGRNATIPDYDFVTGMRRGTISVRPRPFIVVEGLHAFWSASLLAKYDLKIFVDVSSDVGLARRLRRDVCEGARGWSLGAALVSYETFTRPAFESIVAPGRRHADLILNGDTGLVENIQHTICCLENHTAL
jgi:uridine kinase